MRLLEVIRILLRVVIILMIAFLAAPPAARCQEGQWAPTIYGFEGELDFSAGYEQRKDTTRVGKYQTTDAYFVEKIVLSTYGYVYHPRFLLFLAKLGGGLSQENFETSSVTGNTGGGLENNPLWEYELRTLLLPEHPYNLELFALRLNPFIPGRTTYGEHPVTMTEGALFTYKDMPWWFRLGYTLDTTESSSYKSDTSTINSNGGYSVENFQLSGAISRSDSKNTEHGVGSDYTTEKYSLQNQLRFFDRKFFLTSEVNQNSYESHRVTKSLSGDRFTWTEQLTLSLPYRFNADLNYNHYEDTEKSLDTSLDTEQSYTSTTDTAGFTLTYRLYESLQAAYTYTYTDTSTTTGKYNTSGQTLSANYIKRIRGGRLVAGGYLSRMHLDREDAPMVLFESHNARIFDEFALVGTDIDEASIRIRVRDPLTGIFFDLLRDIHYLVIRDANTFRVKILAVPAEVLNPDPLFVYEFNVAYQSVRGSLEIETPSQGFYVKLELLEGYFNPYYRYDHMKQKILSGFVLGGPEESTTNTVGATLERHPYFALLEYQDRQSRYNPSKTDRAEVAYRGDVNPTTFLNLHALYKKTNNYAGVFQPALPSETVTGGDGSVLKRFPDQNLTLGLSGSYTNTRSVYDSNSYTLGGTLSWIRDKLEVSFVASLSLIETEFNNGQEESVYQRYYLLVKRKLF